MIIFETLPQLVAASLQVGKVVNILGETTEGDKAVINGRVRASNYTPVNPNQLITIANGNKVELFPGPGVFVTTGEMRTDSASQLGGVYEKDYVTGDTIPVNAMADKLMYWHNGQFYSVGTDTGFVSNNFDADLVAGRFVNSESITSVSLSKFMGLTTQQIKIGSSLNDTTDSVLIGGTLYPIERVVPFKTGEITEINLVTRPYYLKSNTDFIYLCNVKYYNPSKLSVKALWALGDKVSDDYACIQAACDITSSNNTRGGVVYFSEGVFLSSQQINVTLKNGSQDDIGRITLRGESYGSSMMLYSGIGSEQAVQIDGVNPDVVVTKCELENLTIKPKYDLIGNGVKVVNGAFLTFRAVRVFGMNYAIQTDNALMCNFYDLELRDNNRALFLAGTTLPPNVVNLYGCTIAGNRQNAITHTNGIQLNIFGGDIENNGKKPITGDPRSGGIISDTFQSVGGAVAMNIKGVYFEGNAGPADIWISNAGQNLTYNIEGSTFNRVGTEYKTVNNIYCNTTDGGLSKLNVIGNGFKGFAGYVPLDASRYIKYEGTTDFYDGLGSNVYDSNIEKPDTSRRSMTRKNVNFASGIFFGESGEAFGVPMNLRCVKVNETGLYQLYFTDYISDSLGYLVNIGFDQPALVAYVSDRSSGTYVEIQCYNTGDATNVKPLNFTVEIKGVEPSGLYP